jgi:hypothetical protein
MGFGQPEMKLSEFGTPIERRHAMHITPLHKTIVALRATGLKPCEIAEVLRVDRVTVTSVCSHPDLQEMLARLTSEHVTSVSQDVSQGIVATSMEAFLKVRGLMRDAKSETVQLNAAFDIMDRAGFKAKDSSPAIHVHLGDKGAMFAQAVKEYKEPRPELPQLGGDSRLAFGKEEDDG